MVVSWESTTAYIDLIRTFFELMAFYGFILFLKQQKKKWLYASAVFLGFAISTKLLAIGSLLIFTVLLFVILTGKNVKKITTSILVYWLITIIIVFPWILFAFINTGNPFYPFFSSIYPLTTNLNLFSPIHFFHDTINILLYSQDPISPIYLITFLLVIVYYKKFSKTEKLVFLYCLLALCVWYFTPRTGGGRFLLSFLPIFSLLVGIVLSKIKEKKLLYFLVGIIIVIAFTTVVYRGIANKKYFPVIMGLETKSEFLAKNLNFSYGDFYDTDGYFAKNIKKSDTVLLYGFHNLYYVNFPFIDSSWVKKGDRFTYIAIKDGLLPQRFSGWGKIYENKKTGVVVYSDKGKIWAY